MGDLNSDPSVRQVVQSPGNFSAERYDCQDLHRGDSGEHRLDLPAEARRNQRSPFPTSPLVATRVRLRVVRGAKGRR
jgi:hypothetical protein